MGLETLHLEALKHGRGGKLLSFGVPDFLLGDADLAHYGLANLPDRADRESVARWHGWSGRVVDASAGFSQLGWEPTYLDVTSARGGERRHDLNLPLPSDLVGTFDGTLDLGTSEHIFSIGEPFRSAALSLKEGGLIIHANPCTMNNHGFWNVSPGVYRDFYEGNGFETILQGLYGGPVGQRTFEGLSRDQAYARVPLRPELMNLYCARRTKVQILKFPVQRKYAQNPNLKT